MQIELNTQMTEFVHNVVSTGQFSSADEVIHQALLTYQTGDYNDNLDDLRHRIQSSVFQMENGEGTPLDMEEIKKKARARRRSRVG